MSAPIWAVEYRESRKGPWHFIPAEDASIFTWKTKAKALSGGRAYALDEMLEKGHSLRAVRIQLPDGAA